MTPPPSPGRRDSVSPAASDLADALVPVAAELIGCVRDFGPEDVDAVLAKVPNGMYHSLAVLLAAMVDPDRTPAELLAWTNGGPVQSRVFTPAMYSVTEVDAAALGRVADRRREVARLSEAGLSTREIADRLMLTTRSVVRHRAAIRAMNAERAS